MEQELNDFKKWLYEHAQSMEGEDDCETLMQYAWNGAMDHARLELQPATRTPSAREVRLEAALRSVVEFGCDCDICLLAAEALEVKP